jgi:hypothetical protein
MPAFTPKMHGLPSSVSAKSCVSNLPLVGKSEVWLQAYLKSFLLYALVDVEEVSLVLLLAHVEEGNAVDDFGLGERS